MRLRNVLFTAALLLLGMVQALAQQLPPIPTDTAVRIGHLSNGLTYYIRHNAYPEHTASFYIAQKVGSLQENDDQRGLAHLLEHLAFNGTEHFKDDNLRNYLQSIGVEYGSNLNAYTGFDQTVYYFTNVPTTRATAIDSCMLILKDWSNGITLSQKAIDDERDVVHNEYRMRMTAQQRILERALPKLYPGSKYGERMPIGLMSVVDGCKPDVLRAYYHKWYRPDNQALIIVGDVDVDKIEATIKKLFSGITVPKNAAKVVPVAVPDNAQPIIVVDKDKEQQQNLILSFLKHEATPDSLKGNMEYMIEDYAKNVISSMLNERFSELSQDASCPYIGASAYDGQYLVSRTEDAFTLQLLPKPGKTVEAFQSALEELKRVHDFGFLPTEYARAKADFLSAEEKAYSNRNKMKNEEFTSQYVDNFIEKEPIPSVADEYNIYKMIVPNIPVQAINEAAKELVNLKDSNFVTLVSMQDKEGVEIPTEASLKAAFDKAKTATVTAWVDNTKQEPLIAQEPKAGKIVKTVEDKKLGYTILTLSNGARVVLKKTDFKDDEVKFLARANGGMLAVKKDVSFPDYQLADQALNASGLGNFSNTELTKALAGKQASTSFSLTDNRRLINGSSTPKDLKTLLQLVYLDFTAVKKDEKSVNNSREYLINLLKDKDKNPNIVYQDSVLRTTTGHDAYSRVLTADDVKAANYDNILALAKKMYGNAADFTFYFVGNFNVDSLKPLIQTYIASLPAKKGATLKVLPYPTYNGEVKNLFTKSMENPQSQAREYWRSKPVAYSLRNDILNDISARLLEMDYNDSIREKLSAAYYAGATQRVSTTPDKKAVYSVVGVAMLNPNKVDEALPYFFVGMKKAATAPDAANLQKVKEILLKQADVNAKDNDYWLGILVDALDYGRDSFTDYKKTVSSVTAQDVANYLKTVILSSGDHAEIIMRATK